MRGTKTIIRRGEKKVQTPLLKEGRKNVLRPLFLRDFLFFRERDRDPQREGRKKKKRRNHTTRDETASFRQRRNDRR